MKYIIIIALLAVAAGCGTEPRMMQDHLWVRLCYNCSQFMHLEESCPHPSHQRNQSPQSVDWKNQIERAAPGSIEITGSIVFEHDTLNRLMEHIDYACAKGRLADGKQAYFRLEAYNNNGVLSPSTVLHIHTCSTNADTCRFLFDHRGYYKGCNCGGDVTVVGLP
jgi:hypothetical protein